MRNHSALSKAQFLIRLTVIAAILSSASISLILPLSNIDRIESKIFSYVVAAVFWVGLILMFVTAHITSRVLCKSIKKLIQDGIISGNQPIGAFSFSREWKSLVLYLLFGIGLLIIIYDIGFGRLSESVVFPAISVTFLSFAIHCVIDGRNYKAYKLIKRSVRNGTKNKV